MTTIIYCPECDAQGSLDHHTNGDLVCICCGLVIEERIPEMPFLPSGSTPSLLTCLARTYDSLAITADKDDKKHEWRRSLLEEKVSRLIDALSLPISFKQSCRRIGEIVLNVKQGAQQSALNGQYDLNTLAAAMVYLAIRDSPDLFYAKDTSLAEVCAIDRLPKLQVGRALIHLERSLVCSDR